MGSLLFLIYINEFGIDNRILKFADDTKIFTPITTVSLATNLSPACRACDYVYIDYVRRSRSSSCRLLAAPYKLSNLHYITLHTAWWTAIAHTHLAQWALGSNLAVRMNRAINDRPGIQKEAICYQWFKQRLILIKEDTVEPSVPVREFNFKAYATITWHNDRARLGLEPRLADHHSQAARTATLPTAPPMQALIVHL